MVLVQYTASSEWTAKKNKKIKIRVSQIQNSNFFPVENIVFSPPKKYKKKKKKKRKKYYKTKRKGGVGVGLLKITEKKDIIH